MKNILLFGLCVFFACNSPVTENTEPKKLSHDELLHKVDSLETKLRSQQQMDHQLGADMVLAYANFLNEFPEDEKVVEYLFKAGDVSMNMKEGKQAIDFFAKVHDDHLKSDKAQMALFLQAFIYETQLKDLAKAKSIYFQVIAEYPDTKLASDATASIQNLGKSDDELILEFEKKNKKK